MIKTDNTVSVLYAINPPWSRKICKKEKSVELRTKLPNIPLPYTAYLYETKKGGGVGAVIAKFTVTEHIQLHLMNVGGIIPADSKTEHAIKCSCVPIEKAYEYSEGKFLFGAYIKDVVVFDRPKEITDFINPKTKTHLVRPPQAWCYIDE